MIMINKIIPLKGETETQSNSTEPQSNSIKKLTKEIQMKVKKKTVDLITLRAYNLHCNVIITS